MSKRAKKLKVIGATSFVIVILAVLAVAESAYDINLDYKVEIGICLFVGLLYFLGLIPLFQAKGELARILITILMITGYIALFIFTVFACILNPWFWFLVIDLAQGVVSKIRLII